MRPVNSLYWRIFLAFWVALTFILIGTLIHWPVGATIVRACGAAVGGVGCYFLLDSFR